MDSKTRIEWVDQARGWGMILVMLGHVPFPGIAHKLIYSFHMPFFFALSGWLHNPVRYRKFTDLFQARWKTLIIPYFLYSCIGYAGLAVEWGFGRKPWGLSPLDPLLSTLLAWRNSTPYDGTLWFVACLVMTEFGFHWLLRLSGGRALLAFILAFVPLVQAIRFPIQLPFPYPWSLDVAFIAIVFFSFGHLIRTLWNTEGFRKWSPRILVPALATWLAAALLGGSIDMYSVLYQTPVVFVVGALAGIFSLLAVVPRIPASKVIGWIGRHSLVILALHDWFAFSLVLMLFHCFYPGGVAATQWGLLLQGVGFTTLFLLILWPICMVFDRWAPILVGGGRK
jgi:fucose 4-O-acetylase-like acetyltransferase